jgi:beta-N-acetylhexosaminidase
MKIEEWVGQKLMIGVSGHTVTPEIVEIFRETHAGGLIVFRPNFSSANGFRRFISDLENTLGRRLLVAVDHEGGRVIHVAEGITVFPDNLALGQTRNQDYAKKQGEIEALELRRIGIDLNLAPTLDVLTQDFSPNIGIRSYGQDPELVAQLGAARITGMQAKGLSACAKHFPGLGHSPVDPHLNLPVLPTTWKEMKKVHIKPFIAAIEAKVDAVMSSHPVYPNLDPANFPVTFSKRIIHDYLRKELDYQGVILSDDLEMGALREICSHGEAACRTAEAGHDILLICHNANAQREVYRYLLQAYHDRKLDYGELGKSVERIQRLKERRLKRFEEGSPVPEKDGPSLAGTIAKEAIRISKDESLGTVPLADREDRQISVIFPRLSILGNRIFVEDRLMDERKFLEEAFKQHRVNLYAIHIVNLEPTDYEVEEAAVLAKSADLTIFFCFDAHLYAQNRKLLEVIQTAAKGCVIILLRDPYDEEFVKENAVCVRAFGFRAVQIEAAIASVFAHGSKKSGQLEG